MSDQPPGEPSGPPPLIPEPPLPAAHPGFVFQLGDIGVTADTIVTPSGNAPLAGSTWVGLDYTRTVEKIPTWAVIMAVIFVVFCFLGLLFLLVKENSTTGYVEVRVQNGQFWRVTHIPVYTRANLDYVMMQVSQVQAFANGQRS